MNKYYEKSKRESNQRIQEIAEKVTKGLHSEKEYNELAELILPKIKWLTYGYVKETDCHDDIAHDCLFKIFNNIHRYDSSKGKFTTWAFNVAINESLYLQYLAKRRPTILYKSDSNDIDNENSRYLSLLSSVSDQDDENSFLNEIDFTKLINKIIEVISTYKHADFAYDAIILRKTERELQEKYKFAEGTIKTMKRRYRQHLSDLFKEEYQKIINEEI